MSQQQQRSGTDIIIQGRIVWGGVKQSVKKVYGTNTPAIDPKTGKEIFEWAFGLAVPKPSPNSNQHETANFQSLWNALCTEGGKVGFNQPGQGNFHWKFDDGDGQKSDGSQFPQHSKGCFVVACKTRIPLKIYAWQPDPKDGQIKCVQVTDDQIKCGDYVQVALNIEAHGNPNAGLYVNPSYVARIAYGEAIVNAPDVSTIFGNQAPPIPFGGSQTPMGGGQMQVPQFNGSMPQPGPYSGPGMAAPAGQQQQAPAPIQPNYGVLPGQFNPGQPQNGYGGPGSAMGQGQPSQAMSVQGMPGQFNPGQQAPSPGYAGAPAGNPMASPGVPQNTQAQQPAYNGQTPQAQTPGAGFGAPMSPTGPWQPPQ